MIRSLLNRSLRPMLLGINISFLAFFTLLIPEYFFLLNSPARIGLDVSWKLLLLFICGAFLYACLFILLYYLARMADALTSYFAEFWRPLIPGFVVFLLLGQPTAVFLRSLADPVASQSGLLFFAGALLLSYLVCLGLLYYFPVFRGLSISFLLTAALAIRLLWLPFDFQSLLPGFQGYFLSEFAYLSGVFFLYLALHIHFRRHLAQEYQPTQVPPELIKRVGLGFVFALLLLCLLGTFAYQQGFIRGLLLSGGVLLPIGLIYLFSLQWLLSAVWIKRNWKNIGKPDKQRFSFSYSVSFILILMVLGAGSLVFKPAFPGEISGGTFVRYGAFSHELLSLAGVIMDGDGDGQSFWPGRDPDDGNACSPRAVSDACVGKTGILKKTNYESKHTPVGAAGRGRRAEFLFTLSGVGPELSRALGRKGGGESAGKLLILPRPGAPELLQSLLRRQEMGEGKLSSLPALLSHSGVRTLCGGLGGSESYLGLRSSYGLDRGCQVYFAPSLLREWAGLDSPELGVLVKIIHKKFKQYREKETFFWFHYDFQNRLNETGALNGVRELLKVFSPYGRVHLVFSEREAGPLAYYLPLQNNPPTPEFQRIAPLRQALQALGGKTGLLHPEVAPSYAQSLHHFIRGGSLHVIYERKKGRIYFYDGLTGGTWSHELPEKF